MKLSVGTTCCSSNIYVKLSIDIYFFDQQVWSAAQQFIEHACWSVHKLVYWISILIVTCKRTITLSVDIIPISLPNRSRRIDMIDTPERKGEVFMFNGSCYRLKYSQTHWTKLLPGIIVKLLFCNKRQEAREGTYCYHPSYSFKQLPSVYGIGMF